MKFLIVALFIIGVANASVIPVAGQIEQDIIPGIASETLVQGPSTKTRLLGPDGSQIAADAPGGKIVTNEQIPVVAVPVVAAKTIIADPVVELPVPIVAQPVVAIAKSIAEPIAVAPVIENTVVAETVVSSDDSEGQYVPDNSERLFDDGSYKPEITTEEAADDGSYKDEQ